MSVPRRFNKPQFLSKLDVLTEDTAVISRFFNITEFPEVLTQGKSSFLIGGSALLRNDTEVKFEIVNDDSGAVIYTEPVANYLEGTSRRVSIEIYDDNELFGDCTLTVVGELNPLLTPVPPEFRDSYNVRYTRKVYVSGAGVNTQPILFYNQPRIHVTEIVKPYITTTVPTGSITSTGTLNGSPILEDVGATTNTQTEEEPAKFLKRKKKSLRSKLFGGGGNNSFIRKGRRRVRRSSPEADRYTMERLSGVNFDSRMIDGKLRIISASVASSFNVQSYHQVPDLFETDVEDVKNSNTLVPDKPFTIVDTRFNATDPQREVIVPIESANFTVEFTPIPTQSLSTVNFRSYGDIRISRLRTFSGDIDRIKVYARNNDAFGDFEQISDQQIESPELLFNVFGAGNQSLGFFLEQDTIDTYWVKSSNSTAVLTSDNMLNAVSISGSNSGFGKKLSFALNGTYEMTFNDETEYEISFRAIGRKGPKQDISGNSTQIGRLGVFLSGSAFTTNHNLGDELGFQLESVSGTPAFIEVDAGDQEDFDLITEGFKPTFDGKGVVNFVVFGGNFEIADVSIKPASATGFSPNFVQVIAPVPELTSERPDDYEFLAEFYDVNNNVAETIAFASASSFSGGNNYIAGGDNLLSGSVFVGSAIGGGIEMAGVSSGLIRSIGYDGFVSASQYPYSGSPGFMFFSGSVFPGSADNYSGVGLELFGSTGSFFRYRSDPATLEIVTKQFFVGTSGSGEPEQYISGSQGNVEISSSDFHLTPEGNVTASSILLGSKTDGQFLQFVGNQLTVQGNLSVDQIRTPAVIAGNPSTKLNASSSIDEFGLATFKSASIAGFDITPAQINDSDSNLVLKSSGQITGSQVLFTGGRIGGFSLTSNEITATDFVLNPSQKLLSLGSGDNIFIADADEGIQLGNATFANAPFSVTRGGVMKASAGTVAGWTMTDSTLEGGDLILEKTGTIRSRGYQSDVAGSGFILTAASGGFLEVENAKIRGTLATAVFEKESVNAVGGQLYVANSTTLTSSIVAPEGIHTATQRTMSVENASGFVANEILSAKKVHDTGFSTEYILIESSSLANPSDDTDFSGFLFVQRGYGAGVNGDSGSLGDLPSTAQSYSGSQVLVSTGRVGTGYIRINANPSDQATPYIDIVERTGTGLYDVELKARLGDLSGVAGSRNVPLGFTGFGLMSEVAFLSGSNIKLEAPTFLLGDIHSAFVSGSNSFLEISSSRFHLKRDGSMQLGSAGSGITLDSSGNATFNGSITIQPSDLPAGTVSGSSQVAGVTGSLSASSAAAQAQTLADSGSMANAISLTSTGMNILNSDGNTIAEYSADATIGRTSGTNSNVFIDSDGQIDIRKGTQVSASFGTTTTIGSAIGRHVKITNTAVEIKTSADITALSASAAGLEMAGTIKASGGTIGGFTINSDTLTGGVVTLNSAGSIEVGSLSDATTTATTNAGFFADSSGNVLIKGNVSNNDYLKMSAGGGIDIKTQTFDLATSTMILDSGTNSGKISLGASPNSSAAGTNQGTYIDGTGDFVVVGDSSTKFIRFENGNFSIGSDNFSLSTAGDVTMSGDLSAEAGTFQDINVMGSLVPNANAVGTNDGHKVVETWIDETTTIGGGGTAALSATLDELSNSSWGWTAAVNTGAASAVNIKFSDGSGVGYPSVAQMLLTENDDSGFAAGDPPQAFFKSVGQAEGRLKGGPGTRASKFFYDANVYKNHYGNSFGTYGGVPKMGVDLTEAGKTTCTLTSAAISIPLTQTDIFECFLEFAIRDAGNFGGFYNISQIRILDASDDSVLYGDARQHPGNIGNWIIWSIPMCAKAGLITKASTGGGAAAAFNLITSIKIELKVGGFTSSVMSTYHGTGELTANHSGGGGTLDGFIITEMRMRRAPYVAALETENIVITDIYPRRPGTTVTTRNVHKAITRFQAPQFRGSDSDTYVDTSTANLVKIFANGNEIINAGGSGMKLPSQASFLARKGSDQSDIAVNSNVTITFTTEVYDNGSDYSTSTSAFTAPRDGKYCFFARVRMKKDNLSSAKHYTLKFNTTNRTYDTEQIPGNATVGLGLNGMVIADMDAGDTCHVEILIQSGASTGADIKGDSNPKTYFGGFMLG